MIGLELAILSIAGWLDEPIYLIADAYSNEGNPLHVSVVSQVESLVVPS